MSSQCWFTFGGTSNVSIRGWNRFNLLKQIPLLLFTCSRALLGQSVCCLLESRALWLAERSLLSSSPDGLMDDGLCGGGCQKNIFPALSHFHSALVLTVCVCLSDSCVWDDSEDIYGLKDKSSNFKTSAQWTHGLQFVVCWNRYRAFSVRLCLILEMVDVWPLGKA